jgi:ASPIC and UnbV
VGSATRIDYVEVRWPSGVTERFENVAVDGIRALTEGSGKPISSSPHK